MRVLFCTTGGLGHLLPLRPLASALRRRAHSVAWVTAPDALPSLEGKGFDLFAAGPSFALSRRHFRDMYPQAEHLSGEQLSAYTFPRLFGAVLAPAMVEGVEHAIHHWLPDLVVHEPATLAVPLVCQQLGLRNVTHAYGLRPPSLYLQDAMRFFGAHWRARGMDPPADAGLYRHLYLDIAPASLQPSEEQREQRVFRFTPYRSVESSTRTPPAELAAALGRFPAANPTIYVTFGTVFHQSPTLLAAASAAARLGANVVVTVADGDPAPYRNLGALVSVHRFIDQEGLLPHCQLSVSHGGAGTMLGAASHGVPQVVLPQAADHFRNARALSAVNAGRAIEPAEQTIEEVMSAIKNALNSDGLRAGAENLQQEMAAMADAEAAAITLERM